MALSVEIDKPNQLLPVFPAEEMVAGAKMIADVAVEEGFAWFCHPGRADKTGFKCGSGGEAAQLFRRGTGPAVHHGTSDQHLSGGNGSYQVMLVEGHFPFPVCPALVVFAEPVGEDPADVCHGFSAFATADGSAGAAGFVGIGVGESWVCGGSQKGGFSQPGMAADDSAVQVKGTAAFFGKIHDPMGGPGPHGDFSRICRGAAAAGEKNAGQSMGEIPVIPGHVIIVKGENGEAAVDDFFNGLVVVSHLRAEIDMHKEGVPARRGGDDSMEGEREVPAAQAAQGGYLCAGGFAAEGGGIQRFPGEGQHLGMGRQVAVYLGQHLFQHLLPGEQLGKIQRLQLCQHRIAPFSGSDFIAVDVAQDALGGHMLGNSGGKLTVQTEMKMARKNRQDLSGVGLDLFDKGQGFCIGFAVVQAEVFPTGLQYLPVCRYHDGDVHGDDQGLILFQKGIQCITLLPGDAALGIVQPQNGQSLQFQDLNRLLCGRTSQTVGNLGGVFVIAADPEDGLGVAVQVGFQTAQIGRTDIVEDISCQHHRIPRFRKGKKAGQMGFGRKLLFRRHGLAVCVGKVKPAGSPAGGGLHGLLLFHIIGKGIVGRQMDIAEMVDHRFGNTGCGDADRCYIFPSGQ